MELVHLIIEGVSFGISIIGILVVLWGTLEAIAAFLKLKTGGGKGSLCTDATTRQELGAHLLLGLEIFIAADIINSVASPSWQKIGMLGAIVGIRTILSYFLTMEMEKDKGGTAADAQKSKGEVRSGRE